MNFRPLKTLTLLLSASGLASILAACPAMTPTTFSAKGGSEPSSKTESPREISEEPRDDFSTSSPFAKQPALPGPEASVPNADKTPPQPLSPPPSGPEASPLFFSGPSSPAGPIGPVATADDPMAPRADKEGAGDCPSVYALSKNARIHFSDTEDSIAGIDKNNPTFLEMTGLPTLSAHFRLEALLPGGDVGTNTCADPTTCNWDDRPVGYVRFIMIPGNGHTPTYADLPILSDIPFVETFAEGPPDLHLAAHNIVLENLPAPTGSIVELHYVHNIYKRAMLASDPMAGNPWAACNVVIGQPPNFSETPAPYTTELQTNFDTFRAEGKVHTAAVFKIVRTKLEMIAPQEKPSLRDFRILSR